MQLPAKPAYGTPIDRSHPFAAGLAAFHALNEGGGPFAYDSIGDLGLVATGFGPSTPWDQSSTLGAAISAGPNTGAGFSATLTAAQARMFQPPLTVGIALRRINGNGAGATSTHLALSLNNSNAAQYGLFVQFRGTGSFTFGGLVPNASGYTALTNLSTSSPLVDYVVFLALDGASYNYVVNGASVSSGAAVYAPTFTATAQYSIGNYAPQNAIGSSDYYWAGAWRGVLSAARMAQMSAGPNAIYRMFRPAPGASFAAPAAPSSPLFLPASLSLGSGGPFYSTPANG